jgi:DUF4097 and DUF4098 domain-containing protein YvlB
MVSVDSQALIEREEKRFTVKGMPHLQLKTFDGAIEIRSWERSEVLVEIEKRGATREAVDALVIQTDQDGDRIVVDVKKPAGERFGGFAFHTASAKLIVSIPQRSDVNAHSGDGSIRIERVAGRLELETGDGSIRASDVNGDMTLHTGDGSVHVSGAQGQIDVNTGDGSVEVAGSLVAVKLRTGDGSIVYRADENTSMTDDWDISTGDGSVTLYLPPDFSGDVDARTNDGVVRNELRAGEMRAEASPENDAGSARRRDRDQDESSRRSIRMRLGGGGKVLKVRTGDGTIRLRQS